jgi:hypothetical protein
MKKVVLTTVIGVTLALAAVVLCAGCIGSDPIVGTWDAKVNIAGFDVGSASVTFNADGTGSTTGSLAIFLQAPPLPGRKSLMANIRFQPAIPLLEQLFLLMERH